MPTYTAVPMPCDPVSPSNPIIIQCRINPTVFYNQKGIDDNQNADYLAPPATLVFAKRDGEKTSGINSKHTSMKRKRGGDVHDIITNMYKINTTDRVPKHTLRCIGVTYDGVLDAKGARNHPDKVGRLAVIISGAVTIVCNKDDLAGLSVGDMLEWRMEDNKQIYNGLNPKWSTARIGKASMGGGITDIEMPYGAMFGAKKSYESSMGTDLIKQVRLIKTLNKSTFVEKAFYEGTTPKQMAEAVAHVLFSSIGKKLTSRNEWIELLYRNPESGYYTAFPEPHSEDSIMWGIQCFGDGVTPGWLQTWDNKAWFDKDTDGKVLSQIKKMSPMPAKGTDEYFAYKAMNGMEFDADDVALMTTNAHYSELDKKSSDEVAKFIIPLLGERSSLKVYALAIGKFVKGNQRPAANLYDLESYATLSKTGFDFFNISDSDATNVINNRIVQLKTSDPKTDLKFRKEVFAKALNLHHDEGSSTVFGMLLEKSQHSNEARVLLCPGACM